MVDMPRTTGSTARAPAVSSMRRVAESITATADRVLVSAQAGDLSIVVRDEGVRHLTDGVSAGGSPDRLPRLPGPGCTSSDDKTMRIAVRARALRSWGW
jgi:hypothetical protein